MAAFLPRIDARHVWIDSRWFWIDAREVWIDAREVWITSRSLWIEPRSVANGALHVRSGSFRIWIDPIQSDRASIQNHRESIQSDRASIQNHREVIQSDRAVIQSDRVSIRSDRAAIKTHRASIQSNRTVYPSAGTRKRALTLSPARRTEGVVTYDEAAQWLKRIGGTTIMANAQKPGKGTILVIVENAEGRTVSRHVVFDDALTGLERERAVREAFTRACEELKIALE